MIFGGLLLIAQQKKSGRPSCVGRQLYSMLRAVSATWPESVRRLAATFMRDPIRITVGSDELSANKRIEQVVEVLDYSGQKE